MGPEWGVNAPAGRRGFSRPGAPCASGDGGNGREVLERRTDRSFPVLVFTSKDEQEMFGRKEWDRLKALGANDILIKGINVADDLQRKVEDLLNRG